MTHRDAEEKEKNGHVNDDKAVSNVEKNSLFRIVNMDFYIISEWLRNINILLVIPYMLMTPMLFLIGFVITKHFTLNVNRFSSNGEIHTHLISNQKYISDITENAKRKGASWSIGTFIQPEYWAIRLRGKIFFEDWVIQKFSSEYIFYEFLYENICHRNKKRKFHTQLFHSRYGSYEKYMYDMVDFSILCSCIQNKPDININLLSYKVKNLLEFDKEDKHYLIKKDDSIIEVFNFIKDKYLALSTDEDEISDINLIIFFFYLHGN